MLLNMIVMSCGQIEQSHEYCARASAGFDAGNGGPDLLHLAIAWSPEPNQPKQNSKLTHSVFGAAKQQQQQRT